MSWVRGSTEDDPIGVEAVRPLAVLAKALLAFLLERGRGWYVVNIVCGASTCVETPPSRCFLFFNCFIFKTYFCNFYPLGVIC